MITKNSNLTYKSGNFIAGMNILKGDVLQFSNGKVYKICPGPILYTNYDLSVVVAEAKSGKMMSALSEHTLILAGSGTDHDWESTIVQVYNKYAVKGTINELVAGSFSTPGFFGSTPIDTKRVLAAGRSANTFYGVLEQNTPLTLLDYQTAYPSPELGYRPALFMFDDTTGFVFDANINSTNIDMKVKFFTIDSSTNLLTFDSPTATGDYIIHASLTTSAFIAFIMSTQIIWMGENKFILKYSSLGVIIYLVHCEIESDGTVTKVGSTESITNEYNNYQVHNAIGLNKDYILLLTATYDGNNYIKATVYEVDDTGLTEAFSSNIMSDSATTDTNFPSSGAYGVALGKFSQDAIAMMWYSNQTTRRLCFGILEVDFKNEEISLREFVKTLQGARTTASADYEMVTLTPEKLAANTGYHDTFVRIIGLGSNPYLNALGVANESVSEGDSLEVVFQGLIDATGLGLTDDTTYYGTYWGGMTEYIPENLEVKNEYAYRFQPRILEVGKMYDDNRFYVTMKHLSGEGMQDGRSK